MADEEGTDAFLDADDDDEAEGSEMAAGVDLGELVAEVERFLRDRDTD